MVFLNVLPQVIDFLKTVGSKACQTNWSWLADSPGVPRIRLSTCYKGNLRQSQVQARSPSAETLMEAGEKS